MEKTEYGGFEISMDSHNFFVVKWDSEDLGRFESYAKAVSAIDERLKKQERLSRVKCSLAMITEDRRSKLTVTGIHSGHGGLITTPRMGRPGGELYLDHPKVISILDGLDDANKRVAAFEQELLPFQLPVATYERERKQLATPELLNQWYSKATKLADAL
jgi:hypothetical protein